MKNNYSMTDELSNVNLNLDVSLLEDLGLFWKAKVPNDIKFFGWSSLSTSYQQGKHLQEGVFLEVYNWISVPFVLVWMRQFIIYSFIVRLWRK